MKTNTIIMTALLAATVAAPAFAAGNMQDQAVQAAADTNATVNEIGPYVAAAAKQSPTTAPALLTFVLNQRRTWSVSDVRDLYGAVLVGANLWESFNKDLRSYKDGQGKDELGVKLLDALKKACDRLHGNTFDSVIKLLVQDANGASAEGSTQTATLDPHRYNICDTDPRDPRPNPVPVTPEPISPQN
ncbi:MAG: hypothetical protein MJ056_09105 [Akkermansia sp.]|nr:hypothetical protein [Akkermansia sp.]